MLHQIWLFFDDQLLHIAKQHLLLTKSAFSLIYIREYSENFVSNSSGWAPLAGTAETNTTPHAMATSVCKSELHVHTFTVHFSLP